MKSKPSLKTAVKKRAAAELSSAAEPETGESLQPVYFAAGEGVVISALIL